MPGSRQLWEERWTAHQTRSHPSVDYNTNNRTGRHPNTPPKARALPEQDQGETGAEPRQVTAQPHPHCLKSGYVYHGSAPPKIYTPAAPAPNSLVTRDLRCQKYGGPTAHRRLSSTARHAGQTNQLARAQRNHTCSAGLATSQNTS
jgi:hypothetical protein